MLPVAGLSAAAHRLLAVLGAVVVLWVTEAIPLAVTAMLGPALCVLLGNWFSKGSLSRLCGSDHFSFSWQLSHCGSDAAARAEPAHCVRYHARGRNESDSVAGGLLGGDCVRFLVGLEHRNDGDDVPDRAGDSQGESDTARFWNGLDADDSVRCLDWRHGHAGRHAAKPDWAWTHRNKSEN